MVTVKRANVILDVKDSEVDHYYNLGYDILDENGNVIKETIPTDLHTLQKAFVDNKAKIEDLNAEIKKLKDQLAKAKKQKAVEN